MGPKKILNKKIKPRTHVEYYQWKQKETTRGPKFRQVMTKELGGSSRNRKSKPKQPTPAPNLFTGGEGSGVGGPNMPGDVVFEAETIRGTRRFGGKVGVISRSSFSPSTEAFAFLRLKQTL
jgi:hypothetical protein